MLSFQQLCESYLERRLRGTPSHRKFSQIHRQYFREWSEHPSHRDLKDWHHALSGVPAHANKALMFLKAMYGWAIKEDLWDGANPASGVTRHPTFRRKRTIREREMPELLKMLPKLPAKYRVLFTVLLTTGCRVGEALVMQWTHVDLAGRCWHKPMTKNGSSQDLPLPMQTCEAIMTLERSSHPYVFAGLYEHPLSRTAAEKVWHAWRRTIGLQDVTLHDFRRTVNTRLMEMGVPRAVCLEILNHSTQDVHGVYEVPSFDAQERALQRHANLLLGGSHATSSPHQSLVSPPISLGADHGSVDHRTAHA